MAVSTPEIERLKQLVDNLTVRLDAANDALKQYRQNNRLGGNDTSAQYFAKVRELQATIDDLAAQRAAASRDLFIAQQQAQQPVASSGDTVKEDQKARTSLNDDNPNPSQPGAATEVLTPEGRIRPQPATTQGTNAVVPATLDDGGGTVGTDQPTKPATETQATSPSGAAQGAYTGSSESPLTPVPPVTTTGRSADDDGITSPSSPGTAAESDDGTVRNPTQTAVTEIFGGNPIEPEPNILNQCSTYAYSISVYLMTPESYLKFLLGEDKNIADFVLLFQSAGANVNARNKYFMQDFYIDNVEIKSIASGRGTGSVHNSTDISFTLTEPNGITLIDRLKRAMNEYIFNDDEDISKEAWAAQNFMMAIRWYGYDANGNLIKNAGAPVVTDPNAITEKFIPFQLKTLSFKITNRLTEYQWECAVPGTIISLGQDRGTIPYNIEIAAGSVQEAFLGEASVTPESGTGTENTSSVTTTSSPAPPKADAAPSASGTMTRGLIPALNQYQQDQVKAQRQDYADEYVLEFAAPIGEAKITYAGGTSKKNVPMNKSDDPAQKLDANRQSADFTSNTIKATAGMQLIQLIEQVVRNSTYITDQATVVIDPNTQQQKPNAKPNDSLAWFNVMTQAVPIKWDKKRNDFAYRITYVVTPYSITTVDSNYFPNGTFRGVHKSYKYWFTGQNDSVIAYEATYNNLFSRVMTGAPPQEETTTAHLRQLSRRINRPRSDQSSQGGDGRVNEPMANAADYLYSPEDLAKSTMTILGDPAWLYQADIMNMPTGTGFDPAPFLSDGTINQTSGQVYYEIAFNKPTDYDLNTGLLDGGSMNFDSNRPEGNAGTPSQSFVYLATNVTSNFKQGKFTQELEGSLFFPPDDRVIAASTDAVREDPNQSAAETARLSRQNTILSSGPSQIVGDSPVKSPVTTSGGAPGTGVSTAPVPGTNGEADPIPVQEADQPDKDRDPG